MRLFDYGVLIWMFFLFMNQVVRMERAIYGGCGMQIASYISEYLIPWSAVRLGAVEQG